MFCPRCRTENGDAAIRCAGCGAPIAFGDERPGPVDAPLSLDRRGRVREEGEAAWESLRPVPIDWEMAPPAEATPSSPRVPGRTAPRRVAPPRSVAAPVPAPVPVTSPATSPSSDLDFDLEVDDEVEVHRVRAPAWRRAASWIVDGGAIAAGSAALLLPVLSPALGPGGLDAIRGLAGPALLVVALVAFAYLWLGTALMGATPGLRMAGLRIVGPDGRRPTPGRAAVRSLLAVAAAGLLGAGILLALFTRSGQGAHDLGAGTWVVLALPAERTS